METLRGRIRNAVDRRVSCMECLGLLLDFQSTAVLSLSTQRPSGLTCKELFELILINDKATLNLLVTSFTSQLCTIKLFSIDCKNS